MSFRYDWIFENRASLPVVPSSNPKYCLGAGIGAAWAGAATNMAVSAQTSATTHRRVRTCKETFPPT